MSKDTANHFTLLGKIDPMRTLGTIQKAAGDICDSLSGHKVTDHPLCEGCTHRLLEQLDTQLFLTDLGCLESGELAGEDERDALRTALRGLEQEEARPARELEDADRDRAKAVASLRQPRPRPRSWSSRSGSTTGTTVRSSGTSWSCLMSWGAWRTRCGAPGPSCTG